MKTFIYALINPMTNQVFYVGKSNNPQKRHRQHINDSKRNKSKKEKYIHSMLVAGHKPELMILEEVANSEWKEKEKHYISKYSQLVNDAKGGGSYPDWTGRSHTEETKRKISEANKGKIVSQESRDRMKSAAIKRGASFPSRKGMLPANTKKVYEYSLQGKFLNEYKSAAEAGRQTGIPQSSITRCCNGKMHRAQDKVFLFEMNKKIKPFRYIHDRTVYQYDIDGNFVAEYTSVKDAEKETGINRSNISVVATHSGKQKTAGGFKWEYEMR